MLFCFQKVCLTFLEHGGAIYLFKLKLSYRLDIFLRYSYSRLHGLIIVSSLLILSVYRVP